MAEIVFEKEKEIKEIYQGTYPQDGIVKSEEEIIDDIMDEMKRSGIDISNPDEIHITFEGAYDDGVSDTLMTSYTVTREKEIMVPYRVTREEVYSNTYILDGLNKSKEQQKQEILDQMAADGINVDNPDEFEIEYEGAYDNESETQATEYVVYRVTKEKADNVDISDEEIIEIEEDEQEDDFDMDFLKNRIKELEDEYNSINLDFYDFYKDYINEIYETTDNINNYSKELVSLMEDYQEKFDELRKAIEEKITKEEEIEAEKLKNENDEYTEKRNNIIKDRSKIRKSIDNTKKEIAELKAKRNKINNKFDKATTLGISSNEYDNIIASPEKENMLNNIINDNNLSDIIKTNPKKRTEEQKQRIRESRKEIRNKIIKEIDVKKEIDGNIQLILNIDNEMIRSEEPRSIRISTEKLDNISINITININGNPIKLKGGEKATGYEPGKSPEDMNNVSNKNNNIFSEEEREKVAKYLKNNQEEKEPEEKNDEVSDEDILALQAKIEELEKAIDIIKGLDEQDIKDRNIDLKGLIDLYNESKEKLNKLLEEKNKQDTLDVKSSEEYQKLLDEYNQLVRKKIRLNPNNPKNDDKLANINKQLDELREKMQESLENQQIEEEEKENPTPERTDENESDNLEESNEVEITSNDLYKEYNKLSKRYEQLMDRRENLDVNDPKNAKKLEKIDREIEELVEKMKEILEKAHELEQEELNNMSREEINKKYVGKEKGKYKLINGRYLANENTIEGNITTHDVNSAGEVRPAWTDAKAKTEGQIDGSSFRKLPKDDTFQNPEPVPVPPTPTPEPTPGIVPVPTPTPTPEPTPGIVPVPTPTPGIVPVPTPTPTPEPTPEEDDMEQRGFDDVITVFRDLDNDNQLYVRKNTFERFFKDQPKPKEVRINGALCYAITQEQCDYLESNKDNDYSPYSVRYVDVHLGKVDDVTEVEEETVVIYKAVDEDDQLYATKDVHDKFGLETEGDPIEIQGQQCYKVSPEKDKIINEKAKQSENPKINVVYKPVYVKKKQEEPKVEKHYQEVLDKLTTGLEIHAKDGKRCRASNVKIFQTLKDEEKSGNTIYNIVHLAPAIVKSGVSFLRKMASKLLLTKRGREVTKEINARLNGESENEEYNLTDEDLEILWQHYKGRNLRADMNNQINPMIIAKLREYGLKKVEALNNEIKQHYLAFIAATDEIENIKEELANTTDENEKAELQNKLKDLYKFAAESVKIIEDRRTKADDLLSNGVHGIEEDFKAVESKMNYIGLRFSKQNDFDNELQHRLAVAGNKINTAKAYNDDEGLVEAFIDYEKIYYEETEVKNSIVGRRSTGKKWYQPVAEVMDYRDDPLIRDVFTTIATVSAAVSIANGIITHCVKQQQVQNDINNDINATNAANKQYDASVQHEVQNIQAQRQAEIQGLQGQMNKDVRDALNTGERGIMDKSGWNYGGSYHADDAILHTQAQNLFNSSQSQIHNIMSQLQSGAITETQAIEMLAKAESNLSTTINNALQPLYNASKAYSQGHTFAYDATLVPTEWFANHPNAFVDFNNALVAVNQSADALSMLSPSFMQTIGSLPSDLATTLAAGISSLALVKNVQSTMKNKTSGKNIDHRRDEIGEMFGQHVVHRGEEEEEKERTR